MSDPPGVTPAAWSCGGCVPPRASRPTEEAISNPTRWAVWPDEEVTYVDRESGEPVDEDAIDFYTEHHPEQEAEEGLRHVSTVIEKAEVSS
jgi:ParB family chromosome partitioning protein